MSEPHELWCAHAPAALTLGDLVRVVDEARRAGVASDRPVAVAAAGWRLDPVVSVSVGINEGRYVLVMRTATSPVTPPAHGGVR